MPSGTPLFQGRLAGTVRRTVTSVVFVIAALSFAFGFGNGWQLGLALGVSAWIAPLVAPAVDLSVVALLASVQLLRAYGVGGRLLGPRLLLVLCGGITLALNTVSPILHGQLGRACFDAVGPVLLLGWSDVGPRLLGLLHSAVPDSGRSVPTRGDALGNGPAGSVPERAANGADLISGLPIGDSAGTAVPSSVLVRDRERSEADGPLAALVARARQLDAEHRAKHGQPITRDKLRARLKISNALAGDVLRHVRTPLAKRQ